MAERKISLEMSNASWGKIGIAVQHELNRMRNTQLDGWPTAEDRLRRACDIATMARIKTEFTNQRRAIRYGQVTDQSVSKSAAA